MAQSQLTETSASWVQVILFPQPRVVEITGTCHRAWLMFILLVETGFRHISQAGFEPLTSGDLPTSASQSAGIAGVATVPSQIIFLNLNFLLSIASM